ncbi:uncharacterized protein LOC126843877 [Adelges cooleyi]|uniref:uncharacterized protein LOC126843877 n=1 Tax=Adelges cooleyi TaxID=133065 RepID=UPI0021804C52|nr:uncharacterized protein LOC126843877 [Adelges cooleyi]
MNSIMRLRCVMLFAIFSFGLIISLHAASPPRTSSPDTPPSKRHKSSEEAGNEEAGNEGVGDEGVGDEVEEEKDEKDEDEEDRPLDENAIDEGLNSYDPITSLQCRLIEPYLYKCFQKDEKTDGFNSHEFHPFYADVVEDAQKLIIAGKDGDASEKLITATQAMVVLEEVDCADVLEDKEAVDSMWENWHDDTVTVQEKEGC